MKNQQIAVRDQAHGEIVSHDGLGGGAIAKSAETSATAVAERAKAEVQARHIVAFQNPRSIDHARVRTLAHCRRLRFAEAARYKKPIGKDKFLEGASIRFVEAALQEYGNVYTCTSVVFEDSGKRIVKVSLTDLERNITYDRDVVITREVERRSSKGREVLSSRLNSWGDTIYIVRATDDELATKQGALESKAIRTLGLRILPADIVDEAMDLCVAVVASEIDADPTAARKKLADAFAELGISPKALADFLEHDLASATPGELTDLRAIHATLKSGEATWKDVVGYKVAEDAEPDDKKKRETKGAKALKAEIAARRAKEARPAIIDVPPDAAPVTEKNCADCGVPVEDGDKCPACDG